MEQRPGKANRFWTSQEIHHILWNQRAHYRIHKHPPPVPNLSQNNPFYFLEIYFNVIFSSTARFSKWSLSNRSHHRNLAYASHVPKRATCLTLLILLDLITRSTILGEEYRSLSSSLCNFHHSPVTSSLLGPNILLKTLFSNSLSLRFFLYVTTKFHTHTKKQAKLQFCKS